MTPVTYLLVLLIALIGMASYSAYSLTKKIFCTFRRKDNTRLEKWAQMTQGRIEFDGGWYYVRPDRTYQALYTKGIHQLIPTWIRVADYRWDSSQPLDPKNFNNEYESPESRKQLDKEEDIRALHEGNRKAQGQGKQGMLSGWMPIITVIGFVILGFIVYMAMKKIDQLGFAMNVIQQQLGQIGK